MKTTAFFIATILLVACNTTTSKEQSNTASKDSTVTTAPDQNVTASPADTSKNSNLPAYGIDISKYQGDEIEFLQKKGDSLTFIICRASLGRTGGDQDFTNNWKMIPQKGFVRGAYHVYYCVDSPLLQARHFVSFVSRVDSFTRQDFPPIIDFEEASVKGNCPVQNVQTNLLVFLKEVQRLTGRTPIIYTDNYTGGKYLNNPAFLTYPLFIADYNKVESPALPGAWKGKQWALWQKSESYVMNHTTDDFDIFNGSEQELKAFISRH